MRVIPVDVPPESGILVFDIWTKPVSAQSTAERKKVVFDAIRMITMPVRYILLGDISVELKWFINEEERYESDSNADVDNIVKPILDALSGPDGLVVNDCQVQPISSSWLSRVGDKEHIEITVSYEADAYFEKKKLMFVQLHRGVCMPLSKELKPEQLGIFLKRFERQYQIRDELMTTGVPSYAARDSMSIQRAFHRTRVNGFSVRSLEDMKGVLGDLKGNHLS